MLLTPSVEGCQCSKNEFLNEFLRLTFRFLQTQGSEFLTDSQLNSLFELATLSLTFVWHFQKAFERLFSHI